MNFVLALSKSISLLEFLSTTFLTMCELKEPVPPIINMFNVLRYSFLAVEIPDISYNAS